MRTNNNNKGSNQETKNKKNKHYNKPSYNAKVRESMKAMSKEKFEKVSNKPSWNDPDWYFTNRELAEQVCTFPFPYFLGESPTIGKTTTPTVCVGWLNPSPGNTALASGKSGVNMAAQKLYTRLSIASGRTAQYQQNDVIMSILSIGEVVSLIEYARRFFGLATTYNMRNRVFARRILTMLAGQYYDRSQESDPYTANFGDDFVTHLADYRMELNSIITKINQIPILYDIGYMRKCMELYQKVFVDAPLDTAQIYALCPWTSWVLDETGENGSFLRTVEVAGALDTFQDLLDIINEQTEALLNSTTLNYVYADIFNYQAKFSTAFLQLDFVLEGYAIIPEFDTRFLQMIHNASAIGHPVSLDTDWSAMSESVRSKCTQDNNVEGDPNTGALKYNPVFRYQALNWTNGQTAVDVSPNAELLFDFPTNNPELADKVDDIMYRCGVGGMYAYRNPLDTTPAHNKGIDWAACLPTPDHYITYFTMFGKDQNMFVEFIVTGSPANCVIRRNLDTSMASGAITAKDRLAAVLKAFSSAPIIFDLSQEVDSEVNAIYGEQNFMTTINQKHWNLMMALVYQGLFELR